MRTKTNIFATAKLLVLTVVVALVPATVCIATPNTKDETAIKHLINYIQASKLIFFRNGSPGDSETAAEHIQDKFQYYEREICSAEDFIEMAASKSMLSGEPYLVELPSGEKKLVSEFLRDELIRYRKATKPEEPNR